MKKGNEKLEQFVDLIHGYSETIAKFIDERIDYIASTPCDENHENCAMIGKAIMELKRLKKIIVNRD